MIIGRNVVYDDREDTPLFRVNRHNLYSFFLKEQDQLRYLAITDFLMNEGVVPYFGGSAPKNFLSSGGNRSDYKDVDILGVTPENVFNASPFNDLKSLTGLNSVENGPTPSRFVQIGNCAFEVQHNPIIGSYMAIYTGINKQAFKMNPIRKLEEIKNDVSVAPVHLSFISEKDFQKSMAKSKKRSNRRN